MKNICSVTISRAPANEAVGTAEALRGGAATKEGEGIWKPGNHEKRMKCFRHGLASSAEQRHLGFAHRARRPRLQSANFRVTIGPRAPNLANAFEERGIVVTFAHEFAQIMAAMRKQARIERSVGGYSRSRTIRTKWLCDRGNESDLGAGREPESLRDFTGVIARKRLERELLCNPRAHFGRTDHLVHSPAVAVADVHVFDKPDDESGRGKVPDQVDNLVLVHAALDDHIDFHRRKPGAQRGVNPAQN